MSTTSWRVRFLGFIASPLITAIVHGQAVVDWRLPKEDNTLFADGFPLIPNAETFTVRHTATATDGVFQLHAQITHFGGQFVAAWSNHLEGELYGVNGVRQGEDGPGQKVLYSTSLDGKTWTTAQDLFPSMDEFADPLSSAGRVVTANGFAQVSGRLYAIGEVSDNGVHSSPRSGVGRLARQIGLDGQPVGDPFWLDGNPPAPPPGFSQFDDPVTKPAIAEEAAAIRDYLGHPLNERAWDFRTRPPRSEGAFMIEPTTYQRPDGSLVRLYRDFSERGFLYASQSTDGGATFSTPVQTNIPDWPAKSTSGQLPDGRTYLIGNFIPEFTNSPRRRDPLILAISRDGINYDWAAAIRFDAPWYQYPGHGKITGFQYPSATVVGDDLWVIYANAKEDIEVTKIPIPQFSGPPTEWRLLAAGTGGDKIVEFNGVTGQYYRQLYADLPGDWHNLMAMTVGPDGLIYAAARDSNAVIRFYPSGQLIDLYAHSPQLNNPVGLAFDENGDLYVGNRYRNSILKIAGPAALNAGQVLGDFVPANSAGLDGPFNMAFGPDGDLYVTSGDGDAVLRFDGLTGAPVGDGVFATHPLMQFPEGLVFDDAGNLYVGSIDNDTILQFNPDGSFRDVLVAPGSGILNDPFGMAFGPDGLLYVSNRRSQQITRFDAESGAFIDVFAYGGGLQSATGFVFVPAGAHAPEPNAIVVLLGPAFWITARRPRRVP